jgi:MFS family permease
MGAGTVADIWSLGKEGGTASLFFILGPFLGPTMGPLVGAYMLGDHDNNWRWTQWIMVILAAPVWLGIVLMRETLKQKIIQQPNSSEKFGLGSLGQLIAIGLGRPVRMLCTEIIVFSLTLYTAFAYAMIFSYFASSSYVLRLYYDFNWEQVGLSFISVIVGYVLASFMFGVFDRTLYAKAREAGGGIAAPEHRLYSAMVGGVLLSVGLFW